MQTYELWLRAVSLPLMWATGMLAGDRVASLPSVCVWRWVAGVECYACGMGRAVLVALQGDFDAAAEHHAFWWLVLPVIAAISVSAMGQIVVQARGPR